MAAVLRGSCAGDSRAATLLKKQEKITALETKKQGNSSTGLPRRILLMLLDYGPIVFLSYYPGILLRFDRGPGFGLPPAAGVAGPK